MNDQFKKAFTNLSLSEKRNQLSNELIIIGELLKNFEKKYGINPEFNIKNYDVKKDSILNEDEMLSFIYEDVYNIEKELITVLSIPNINR